MLKHALPPETVKSDVKGDHAHWKALVCFLETNLKAWGMEHHLEPTATPEEFRTIMKTARLFSRIVHLVTSKDKLVRRRLLKELFQHGPK